MARIESAAKRWRIAYRDNGIHGLQDTREGEPSLEEKYTRLEAQINLLKAENELLKKIDLAERRLKGKK